MYADDTILFTTINCFENNEHPNQYITTELSKTSEWLIVNNHLRGGAGRKTSVLLISQSNHFIVHLL